ncbi:MAG: type III-B CRISPR module RAMP protein Cmr1 [Planctomycetaceae bacterium]|nr:MAG: type III-B CRISPR module RAMP protein Cmr1 [Planctomycetaceae bacterium]
MTNGQKPTRVIPEPPSNFEPPPQDPRVTRWKIPVEIVTPYVGGGVVAGEVDRNYPVRPTAIRGQLHYWWRLLNQGDLDQNQLRQREREIFGDTSRASSINVLVSHVKNVELASPGDHGFIKPFSPEAYALFASIQNQQMVGKPKITFELTVELLKPRDGHAIQSIDRDVQQALSAWLYYGGLGGRTRRGCGAVFSSWIQNQNPPAIPASIFLGPEQRDPWHAWKEAVKVYRDFRQEFRGPNHPKTLRNGKTIRVPGRSYWPEPDSIRQVTGCALKSGVSSSANVPPETNPHDHSQPIVDKRYLPSFPRALLGMPINFHFADGGKMAVPLRDPADVQITPLIPSDKGYVEAERMASPVITRPFYYQTKWYPVVIILPSQFGEDFKIRLYGKYALPGRQGSAQELKKDFNSNAVFLPGGNSVKPLGGATDALEGLKKYLLSKGFKQVE